MSLKDSTTLDVGYPILDAKFVNNKTLLVTGGGGEGNNGIPNKITAIKCSFKVADPKRRLQRFREITLPSNEDSPQCLDTAKIAGDDSNDVSVFVGCNQSSQLIKSMNINNNLRKYVFSKDEHLRFIDAAQLEEEITGDADDYPKVVRLTPSSSAGVFMTSSVPSVLYGFNPDTLELNFKYKPEVDVEIKDFHLSPHDDGKSLCYITAHSINTISSSTGNSIASSVKNSGLSKELQKYNLSRIRFIDDTTVIIAASLRASKGAVLLHFSLKDQKITKQSIVSKRFNNIVAIDLVASKDLLAIAGNDLSITILKLSNFKQLRSFQKLHPFAITSVAFSPNGTKLATGSAANTLHVFRISPTLAQGKSTIGTLFQYLITILLVALLGVALQKGHENGQLEVYYEKSKVYGKIGYNLAHEYALEGYGFVKQKLEERGAKPEETANDIFTVSSWSDDSTPEITGEFDTYITNYQDETVVETTEAITSIPSTEVQSILSTIEEVTSIVSTPPAATSTRNDEIYVSEVTRVIQNETEKEGLDTDSFLKHKKNYIDTTVVNEPAPASTPEVESSVETPVAEPVPIAAAQDGETKADVPETLSAVKDHKSQMAEPEPIAIVQDNEPLASDIEYPNFTTEISSNNATVSEIEPSFTEPSAKATPRNKEADESPAPSADVSEEGEIPETGEEYEIEVETDADSEEIEEIITEVVEEEDVLEGLDDVATDEDSHAGDIAEETLTFEHTKDVLSVEKSTDIADDEKSQTEESEEANESLTPQVEDVDVEQAKDGEIDEQSEVETDTADDEVVVIEEYEEHEDEQPGPVSEQVLENEEALNPIEQLASAITSEVLSVEVTPLDTVEENDAAVTSESTFAASTKEALQTSQVIATASASGASAESSSISEIIPSESEEIPEASSETATYSNTISGSTQTTSHAERLDSETLQQASSSEVEKAYSTEDTAASSLSEAETIPIPSSIVESASSSSSLESEDLIQASSTSEPVEDVTEAYLTPSVVTSGPVETTKTSFASIERSSKPEIKPVSSSVSTSSSTTTNTAKSTNEVVNESASQTTQASATTTKAPKKKVVRRTRTIKVKKPKTQVENDEL